MRRRLCLALSLAAALLAAPVAVSAPAMAAIGADSADVTIDVVIPALEELSVTDAQLRWGLNQEVSSGAYNGSCNFLSAGLAGNTGASRAWTLADGFYAATQGNTSIEKPNAAGQWVTDSWAGHCLNASGTTVGTSATETGTGAQVVIDGGVGTINASKKSASISWSGSFTVALYGGLTYWSATDPVLTVVNGIGTLKATVSGYAADRNDSTSWSALPKRTVTLATLPNVALGENGIVTEPAYRQVRASGVEPAQTTDGTAWGAFPQDFLNFQSLTGQGAFWYSSGLVRDPAKVATTLYISYSADLPVTTPVPEIVSPPAGTSSPSSQNQVGTVLPGRTTTTPSPLVGGAAGSVIAASPVAGVVLAAATPVAQTMTWLGGSLIPEAMDLATDHRNALLWSLAGLLTLASTAWMGFSRGWLQLPFRPRSRR